MKALSTLLNTFGWCMAVFAIIALVAESDAGFFGFGAAAATAWVAAWWSNKRGSTPLIPSEARATGDTRECGYCTSTIPASALRCPQCSGEFHHCPHCKELVAVSTRQKFVGLVRGGRTPVVDCLRCGKQLTGPRW